MPDKALIAYIHPVTPGYFQALGLPIVDGRPFASGDMSADQLPMPGPRAPAHTPSYMPIIVSRSAANAWWPGGRAVGRVIRLRHNMTAFDVVGVAQSIHQWGLDSEPGIDAYLPLSAVSGWKLGMLDVAIRHTGDGAGLTSAARGVLAKLAPTLPLTGSATMDARVSESIASPRFDATLLTTFGLFALLLASAGVYASMRYLVSVRRREMSIRLALGASPRDLVRHIVGHGLVLVCVGSVIGVAAALALSRVLKNLLFQISPTDPLAVTAAVLLMGGAALIACWGPARRAAAADPAATLR
ncbi:MAG: FtsX-like permease family protein [Vicinamibacterales bacterium]